LKPADKTQQNNLSDDLGLYSPLSRLFAIARQWQSNTNLWVVQALRMSKAGRQRLIEMREVMSWSPSKLAFHPLFFTGEHQAGKAWLQKSKVSLHIQADSQHHLRGYILQRAIIKTWFCALCDAFLKTATSKVEGRLMDHAPTLPTEIRRSRLIFGAGAVAVCLASILAIAAAIECHNAAAVLAPGTTWTPSLLYGAVLWLWWAGVAYLLWHAGRRRPTVFRLSGTNLLLQIALGCLATTLHLVSLHWSTRLMAYIWSAWRRTGFGGLHFFQFGRFSLDFVTYVLVWLACAIVYMQLAAQRDAFQALELQQQLSTAKLQALQMQLQPHFLFNTLNGITTLVRLGRQKEADTMLSHLNAILKATLSRSTPEKVTLAQELKTIRRPLTSGD
jgi:hypothetical protein